MGPLEVFRFASPLFHCNTFSSSLSWGKVYTCNGFSPAASLSPLPRYNGCEMGSEKAAQCGKLRGKRGSTVSKATGIIILVLKRSLAWPLRFKKLFLFCIVACRGGKGGKTRKAEKRSFPRPSAISGHDGGPQRWDGTRFMCCFSSTGSIKLTLNEASSLDATMSALHSLFPIFPTIFHIFLPFPPPPSVCVMNVSEVK